MKDYAVIITYTALLSAVSEDQAIRSALKEVQLGARKGRDITVVEVLKPKRVRKRA